jgi:hypothetical protein
MIKGKRRGLYKGKTRIRDSCQHKRLCRDIGAVIPNCCQKIGALSNEKLGDLKHNCILENCGEGCWILEFVERRGGLHAAEFDGAHVKWFPSFFSCGTDKRPESAYLSWYLA